MLSAILEREYKIDTTSWWLGEEESYVELSCTKLSVETITEVEERCNKLIRDAIPVTVKVCEKGDPNLDAVSKLNFPNEILLEFYE